MFESESKIWPQVSVLCLGLGSFRSLVRRKVMGTDLILGSDLSFRPGSQFWVQFKFF